MKSLLTLACSLLLACCAWRAATPDRSNIIFILADALGIGRPPSAAQNSTSSTVSTRAVSRLSQSVGAKRSKVE